MLLYLRGIIQVKIFPLLSSEVRDSQGGSW